MFYVIKTKTKLSLKKQPSTYDWFWKLSTAAAADLLTAYTAHWPTSGVLALHPLFPVLPAKITV